MNDKVTDMRGSEICVGCKVSDGLAAGTVFAVHDEQVWFEVEGSIGKELRGPAFNRPENLIVISDQVWERWVCSDCSF